jgi:ABC-type bacteriocin/lantibiotic exporter with double-glycine peptidase domain
VYATGQLQTGLAVGMQSVGKRRAMYRSQGDEGQYWRRAECAAGNALYLYLTGHQAHLGLGDLRHLVDSSRAATLTGLGNIATKQGLPSMVCQPSTAQLATMQMPIVMFMNQPDSDADTNLGSLFILSSYEAHADRAIGYDGTTVVRLTQTGSELFRSWSGYALVPTGQYAWQRCDMAVSLLLGCACFLVVRAILRVRRKRNHYSVTESRSRAS